MREKKSTKEENIQAGIKNLMNGCPLQVQELQSKEKISYFKSKEKKKKKKLNSFIFYIKYKIFFLLYFIFIFLY